MHSAAISVRSALSPSRMYRKPLPSSPIRFSAGISRSSKNTSLVSWLTMFGIGRTVMPPRTSRFDQCAGRSGTRSCPSALRLTSASGVVRASRIIRSECCRREIHTFCPLTT